MKLDVNQLMLFVAVAEELSFSKAAERLNMAQPWLSRQIARLEETLGFKLLLRTTRHVALTKKGERLLGRARMMARELDETRALALALKREDPNRLKIGVPFFAVRARPRLRLFDVFKTKRPNIQLEICTGDQSSLRRDLLNGEIDGLFSTGPVDEPGFDFITLAERRVEVVFPTGDPLLGRESVKLSDLAGRTLAVFPRDVNAALYDELFGAVERVAGRTLERGNIIYTTGLEEMDAISVAPGWSPHGNRGRGLRRPIVDYPQVSRLQLLKRRTGQSEAMEALWRVARDLATVMAAERRRA